MKNKKYTDLRLQCEKEEWKKFLFLYQLKGMERKDAFTEAIKLFNAKYLEKTVK